MTNLAKLVPERVVFLLSRLRISLYQEKGLVKLYRIEMIPALRSETEKIYK